MTCRNSSVNGIDYTFCPDQLPPVADRLRAVMQGRFIDELTGQPLTLQLRVSTETTDLLPRTTATGVAGLASNPYRRFPNLLSSAVTIDMDVSARRFINRSFHRNLGPFSLGNGDPADYPAFFAPVDLGDIAMHREATVIRGRTVQANSTPNTPVSGVTVELVNIWHRFPLANEDPLLVMEAPNIVSLAPGLYSERSSAADTLQRRQMVPVAGEEKRLLNYANAGDRRLRLSDRVNLSPGDLLSIELLGSDRSEVIAVTAVDGASSAAEPADITLAYPLAYDHRQQVQAVRVQPQAAGAGNALTRDAIVDDRTVFLSALNDLASGQFIELSGGAAPEYQRCDLYNQQSDPRGFYSLPPISRVAQMHIRASGGGMSQPVNVVFSPDYDLPENSLSLVFL